MQPRSHEDTTPFSAWCDGTRRVTRAPAILASVWLLTLLVSLPLVLALRGMIADSLGASLAADAAASGVNYAWMQQFADQATGLGTTFRPTILGFGAVLDNLSGFVDNVRTPIVIAGAAAAYLGFWTFLAGGIIDRYARDRATRAHGFFAASGVFFFRFLRLGVAMWLVYAFLFARVHPWLFDRVYPRMTHDITVERRAFLMRVILYVVFGALIAGCNLIFDYAKVRAVVEDRRSMLGATVAAFRFVGRNAGAAVSLYVVNFVLFLSVLGLYALVAPGAGRLGWSLWLGMAVAQLYVVARLWVKLVFWASETALFQGRFAHAGYVAAPTRVWPESPAAEGVSR